MEKFRRSRRLKTIPYILLTSLGLISLIVTTVGAKKSKDSSVEEKEDALSFKTDDYDDVDLALEKSVVAAAEPESLPSRRLSSRRARRRRRKDRDRRRKRKKKKGSKKRRRKRPSKLDEDDYTYDQDYDDEYDRDDGYKAPSSGYDAPSSSYDAPESSYKAPSSSYDAPSYEAPSYEAPSYNAPSYDVEVSYGGGGDKLRDYLNALAAFLPIGLFLAAIPPNIVTISTGRRKRNADDGGTLKWPILEKIADIGLARFIGDSACQRFILCELAMLGAPPSPPAVGDDSENEVRGYGPNSVQSFVYTAVRTCPLVFADAAGISDVWTAVNEKGNCNGINCT